LTDGGNSGHEIPQAVAVEQVPLDAWLDDLEAEREALIMRLRQVEKNLVRYGRLRKGTLPEKVRQQGRF
jgi:hypothetical protein